MKKFLFAINGDSKTKGEEELPTTKEFEGEFSDNTGGKK